MTLSFLSAPQRTKRGTAESPHFQKDQKTGTIRVSLKKVAHMPTKGAYTADKKGSTSQKNKGASASQSSVANKTKRVGKGSVCHI